jgi:NAD+ kinase
MTSHAPTPTAQPHLLLLSTSDRPELVAHSQTLLPLIEKQARVTALDLAQVPDLAALDFDLAVVVGGDGSILRTVHQMHRRQRPVVGVNLGKLGFLADLSPDEFIAHLPTICSGRFKVDSHLMYEWKVLRGGRTMFEGLGLNEIAVLAGPPFAILDVDLYVDGELVTTYSCDGLIISTPVGSTAHSLSAGGPILRQDLQAFVISPISPHTLTNRPVVDSADRIYEIEIPRPHGGTSVVADGRVVCQAEAGDRVNIVRSEACFQRLSLPSHTYYRTLREKLAWGGRLNFKR